MLFLLHVKKNIFGLQKVTIDVIIPQKGAKFFNSQQNYRQTNSHTRCKTSNDGYFLYFYLQMLVSQIKDRRFIMTSFKILVIINYSVFNY